MHKTISIISIILCLFMASCNDSAEDLIGIGEGTETFSDANIGKPHKMTRSVSSTTEEDLEDVVVSGYTSVENGKTMKLLFSSQPANLTGLQAGSIYVTRYET